jgi:hypothetical protein
VQVPKLPALQKGSPLVSRAVRDTSVSLYFQKTGVVSAQLQQVLILGKSLNENPYAHRLGLRTTAIAPALPAPAPCSTAEDKWNDEVVRLSE